MHDFETGHFQPPSGHTSSAPSIQSSLPFPTQCLGIHLFSIGQKNSSSSSKQKEALAKLCLDEIESDCMLKSSISDLVILCHFFLYPSRITSHTCVNPRLTPFVKTTCAERCDPNHDAGSFG